MKIRNIWIIFLLFATVLITGVQGVEVSIKPVTLSPGENGTMDIILDSAPAGISGFQMNVQSDNPSVGKVTGASFPSWASLSEALPGDGGSYALRAIDLNSGVEGGASQVTLATLSVQAVASGACQIVIQNLQIDDDAGNTVQAETKSGTLTISGAGSTPTAQPSPSAGEITIALAPGWNLINIPMQPAGGYETAEIFKDIPSAGHSILSYDGTSGWMTLGKDDRLQPMTGYWIYTTSAVQIPIKVQGLPTEAKNLYVGWNLAGITGTTTQDASVALAGLSSWSSLVRYDAHAQQYRDPSMKEAAGTMLAPEEGFWIYLDAPGAIRPGA